MAKAVVPVEATAQAMRVVLAVVVADPAAATTNLAAIKNDREFPVIFVLTPQLIFHAGKKSKHLKRRQNQDQRSVGPLAPGQHLIRLQESSQPPAVLEG